MITFKQLIEARRASQLSEASGTTGSTVVLAFGRMTPPTSGHGLLVDAVRRIAAQRSADHIIYLSRTQDPKKNPLNVDQKVFYARAAFKGANIVGASDKVRTFIEAAKDLSGKYKNLVMVAGSDRVAEYQQILTRYNGKDFNFDTIEVVSAGDRDPDAEGAEGMSASKMRAAAAANDFALFKRGVPAQLPAHLAKKMFDDVRAGMRLTEGYSATSGAREQYIEHAIFNVGDVVLHKSEYRTITARGANYVVLDENERVWLDHITTTDLVNEAVAGAAEQRLHAARVIGNALGYDDAMRKTDPSAIINSALRLVRSKPLDADSKKLVAKGLDVAKKLGIKFDGALVENSADNDAEDEFDGSHNLYGGAKSGSSNYARLRKIHRRMHELAAPASLSMPDGEEIDDLEDFLDQLSDEDIIEFGFVSDEELDDVELDDEDDEDDDELSEGLSRVERIRARQRMKRAAPRRERAARIAMNKRSSGDVLARRARRAAINAMRLKLARKPQSELSVAEKERVEQRMQRMKPLIKRMALKLIPRVRAIEKQRLSQ